MGQILSSGCGSYTDLDSVTASADDVLEKKIIIDKDGDPVVGTMKNIGAYDTAVSVAANSTDLYLRMHNGAHVTNTISGYPEISCTNASALNAMGIQSMAGGTYTPGASQQTIACTGKRMTSDIIIPGFSMAPANVIKKGVTINTYNQSVTGTWEGYTPTTTYFWNSGNVGGVVGKGQLGFGSLGQVYSNDSSQVSNTLTTPSMIDLRRYTHVFVDIAKSSEFSSASVEIYRIDSSGKSRLLCTFYTTSGSYTRMSYQYDASRQGKLKLVFTQQGTGILTWGVQAV